MTLIDNQEHLIAQTQLLYDELFNSAKYAEAIAIGKLILDLSTAYKELRISLPDEERIPAISPFSATGFGQANFGQINQTIREVIQPRSQANPGNYKVYQLSEPTQSTTPSKYSWSDGFQGVTVPPRETDMPTLPNPNTVSAMPSDYWEDSRRQ